MALLHNRAGVQRILAELEPRIINQTRPGMSCSCGAIHNGPATAVKIEPAGDLYPGQEVYWYLWMVSMSETPDVPDSHHYSFGISEFVNSAELESLFTKVFGNDPDDNNPYRPTVTSEERARKHLSPRMTAAAKPDMLIIQLEFGIAQAQGKTLYRIYETSERFIWNNHPRFNEVIEHIERLQATIEIGGPEPELPTEPRWLTTISEIVNQARHHRRLHFLNLLSTSDGDGNRIVYEMEVIFTTSV